LNLPCFTREIVHFWINILLLILRFLCHEHAHVEVGRALLFRAQVGLKLHTLGSGFYGLENLLNKLSGLNWAQAHALLYKWKSRALAQAQPLCLWSY
jgi:hypothetical protein